MSEKVIDALIWLKRILEEHQVPYQVVGGLAATMHGGSRLVADIDLYIPKIFAKTIVVNVSHYISKPLAHYVEHGWDLEYFQLIYQEQKIEIGLSPGTKIFNSRNGKWTDLVIDYDRSVVASHEGIDLPIMPVSEFITYKSVLAREVDLIDVSELMPSSGA